MKIKDIKEGRVYETVLGIGEVVQVGGTFPPSVRSGSRVRFLAGS